MPPRTNQRWQAGNGAHCITAAARALQAIVHSDSRVLATGFASAVVKRQRFDLRNADAAHRRRTLRWPPQRTLAQGIPTQRVARQVVVVQPVVLNQLVHQAQGQCRIGARQQGDVLMALFGGLRAPWIDANELGPVAFGNLHIAPKMQVAGNRIAAPNQNQIRLCKKLNTHAHFATKGLRQPFSPGGSTNGAV